MIVMFFLKRSILNDGIVKPLKQMNLYLMDAFNETESQVLVFVVQVLFSYENPNYLRIHQMKFVRKKQFV